MRAYKSILVLVRSMLRELNSFVKKNILFNLMIVAALIFFSCEDSDKFESTYSPDNSIEIIVGTEKGIPYYQVLCDNETIIDKSMLGFEFENEDALFEGLEIVNVESRSFDETWEPVYGTDKFVRNQFNETCVTFKEKSGSQRSFSLELRAYNDGVAFRYKLPGKNDGDSLFITQENTMFRFAKNDSAWWIPADEFAYESLYRNNPLSEINEAATPLTISCANGLFLSVHEAALYKGRKTKCT